MAGAEPGDVLAVEVLDIRTQDWGWTAIIPGFGLLPEDFPDAYLKISEIVDQPNWIVSSYLPLAIFG
jgi:acetamidase/formamidase